MPHTDLNFNHWLVSKLSARVRPYALLARWDRPIGIWLLLLPCWWGLALAATRWPDVRLMALFAVGAVVMRGAGCTINDIIDRKLDAQVERTRQRPLPSGTINVWQALVFLALQLGVGLLVLLQFPPPVILWGAASLGLVAIYPLMKRVTSWPQLILGFTFNWGVLLGWVAVRGQIEAPTLLLYSGAVLWTIVYDTLYAQQDKRDDAAIGIKSTARLFGAHTRELLALFAAGAAGLFALAGYTAEIGFWFYVGWLLACGHLAWQLLTWRADDPVNALNKFRSNRIFALLVLGAILAGKIL